MFAKSPASPRRIFPSVFLDGVCIGLVAPVWPVIVQRLSGLGPADVSFTFGALAATYALLVFLCAPLMGQLSDTFGRRTVLMLGLTGAACDYLICSLASSVGFLFCARILAGVCGANVGIISAYIADSSSPEERIANFGMLGALLGAGSILGPALGGLLGSADPTRPLQVAAAITAFNVAYIYFFLGESLPKERRRALQFRGASPIRAFKVLAASQAMMGLAGALILFQTALAMRQSVLLLFLQLRLDWNVRQVGIWLSVVAVLTVFSQALLPRKLVPLLGERRALVLSLVFGASGSLLFGFIQHGWQAYALLLFPIFGVIAGPMLHGAASKLLASERQGEFHGAMASLMSLTAVVGPLTGTSVFGLLSGNPATVRFSGAPFALVSCLIAVSLAIILRAASAKSTAQAAVPHVVS